MHFFTKCKNFIWEWIKMYEIMKILNIFESLNISFNLMIRIFRMRYLQIKSKLWE